MWCRLDVELNQRSWEGTPWLTRSTDRMVAAVKALAALVPARDGGGSRLRSIFKSGKRVKMHTWCFMSSPYGVYIFGHATALGSPQLEVVLQLLCSVSFLMDKAVPRDECAAILNGVARALTLVELHLPSCELDMKLHQLLHLAERIHHLGPSFTTAMWGYESLWGHLVKLMKNKQYPEATCMRSWIQNEMVTMAAEKLPEGLATFLECPREVGSVGTLTFEQKAYWTVTNATAPSIGTKIQPAAAGLKQARRLDLPDGFVLEIHEMYLRHSHEYCQLFGVFTSWMWDQWTDDTTPGHFLAEYLSPLGLRSHSRKVLLHQDSSGTVAIKSKVNMNLSSFCL